MMARPGVAERIIEGNIRYIFWVCVANDQTSSVLGLSCDLGPGVGRCFGLRWQKDTAAYHNTL